MAKPELIDAVFDEALEASRFKVIEDVDEDNQPRMKIQGICQRADKVNKNDRIYPKSVLASSVKKFQTRMNAGRAFGEVDHPDFRPLLQKTSHLIDKVWWDRDDASLLCCEVLVTNTPQGDILKEIVRAGGRPGFSSRGYGDSEKVKIGSKEVTKIKDGFDLQSFDFVINPSVTSAKIRKIMEDAISKINKEDIMDEFKNEAELREAYPELVKKIEDKILEEAEKVINEDDPVPTEKEKELSKRVTDLEAEIEQIKTDVIEKDAKIEKYSTFIGTLVSTLKENEFLPADKEEAQEGDALKETVAELERENKELKEKFDESKTEMTSLKEDAVAAKVAKRIDEVLEGNKHKTILKERLAECKTVEEVDEKLKSEATFIEGLEETFGKKVPTGKGSEAVEEEDDIEEEKKKIREKAKKLAGIKGGKK